MKQFPIASVVPAIAACVLAAGCATVAGGGRPGLSDQRDGTAEDRSHEDGEQDGDGDGDRDTIDDDAEDDEIMADFIGFYRETAARIVNAGGDEVGGIGSPMDADYPATREGGNSECTAIRVVWTGRLVDDAGLEALYLAKLPGANRDREPGMLDDLDGDGKQELVREYELDGFRPQSIPDGVRPACGKSWPVMKLDAMQSIWIISYSSGRHSVIEPTFYNIRAKSE